MLHTILVHTPGLIFLTFLFSTVKPLIVLQSRIPGLALLPVLIPTLLVTHIPVGGGGGEDPLAHAQDRDHVNGTDAHGIDRGQDHTIDGGHMTRGEKGVIGLGPGREIATNRSRTSGVRLMIMH